MRSELLPGLLGPRKAVTFFRNSISILASRSSAFSLLFSAACSVPASASTNSEWSLLYFLTQFPTVWGTRS